MFALCAKKKKKERQENCFFGEEMWISLHIMENWYKKAIVTVKQRTNINTLSLIFIFKTEINYPF